MNSLFAELRRRKVVRVAAAYLATAWLIMQMVNLAVPALELPDWFDGAVFVLLAAGFPLSLVLAWVFDLTPADSRPARPDNENPRPGKLVPIDLVLLAAVAALLGVSLIQYLSVTVTEASIAVLPFVNLSSEEEQEYFADGLSDEIRNQLAKIDGLRVTARTSSSAFKEKNTDARSIGTTLGVDYLLEASVLKSGNQLRINVQLITTADGTEVWSEIYPRELADVFVIHNEIALAVVRELRIVLDVDSPVITDIGTNNVEAYDHFLRGRAAWNRNGPGPTSAAFDEFREATRIDPDFGAAWVSLARAAQLLTAFEPARRDELNETMQRAAERAVAVSPERWDAHAIGARVSMASKDWLGAARALDAAAEVELPPAVERADIEGEFLMQVGRSSEALALFEAALASDPLSVTLSNYTAWQLDRTERFEEARREYERGYSIYGGVQPGYYVHHLWNLLNLRDAAAIRDLAARIPYSNDATSAFIRQMIENFDSPAAGLALLRARREAAGPVAVDGGMQLFAAYFGDIELALEMERDALPVALPAHLWHPLMAEARRTDDFKQIVRDLGLVEYWRESGDWADFCRPVGSSDFECF